MCQINGEIAEVRMVKRDKPVLAYKAVRADWLARGFRPLFSRKADNLWQSRYTVYKSHTVPSKRAWSRTGFHAFRTLSGAVREATRGDIILAVKLWGRVVITKRGDIHPAGYRAHYMSLA